MNSSKKRNDKVEWLVPVALIVLSAVPLVAGSIRIVELSSGAEITPDNARFFAAPLPVVLHILSVSLYSILGAFQFTPGFRRRKPGWHRVVGRWILIPSGLTAALSGLWMTLFYPWPDGDSEILYVLRLLFGTAMLLSIALGIVAIWRRDYVGHGNWMIRGYAIGLGAGTQVLTHLLWYLFFSTPGEFPRAFLMGAGWVINVIVAEWIIRKRPLHSARTSSVTVSYSS